MEHGCRVRVFLTHGMCNYGSHCGRSVAQSLCQVLYSHTFWIWCQLNLSCVPYDDQINGLTEAFSINTANWPYSKVLKTISFLLRILTNMSQDRPGQLHYPSNTYCLFVKRLFNNTSAVFTTTLFQLVTRSSLRQDACVTRDKNMKKEIYCRNQKPYLLLDSLSLP